MKMMMMTFGIYEICLLYQDTLTVLVSPEADDQIYGGNEGKEIALDP